MNLPATLRRQLFCHLLLTLALSLVTARAFGDCTAEPEDEACFKDRVQEVYVAYYGRPADPGGLAFWAEKLADAGGDLTAIIDAFGDSDEYRERFGAFSQQDLVKNIYVQLLGRDADPEGLAFYTGRLASGAMTLGTIALNVADGVRGGTSDADVVLNKLAFADQFTLAVDGGSLPYAGNEQADAARQLLSTVGGDSGDVDRALTEIENDTDADGTLDVYDPDDDNDGVVDADDPFPDDPAQSGGNTPPTAVDDSAQTSDDSAVAIFVAINDSDPDGFLDLGTEEIVTGPASGSVANTGFGEFTYTPTLGFSGQDSFSYRLRDDDGALSNTATVVVTVTASADQGPVAVADTAAAFSGESAVIDVLLNDSAGAAPIDAASLVVVGNPGNGSAQATADGKISYTSTAGFTGQDSFSYRVSDTAGNVSGDTAVTVEVIDPVAADGNPLDNVSAAQIRFYARFGNAFVDQGIGGLFGFNLANQSALDKLTPVSQGVWWFDGNPDTGEEGVAPTFNLATDLQTGTAQYDEAVSGYVFSGFVAGALYGDAGGSFTVSTGDGLVDETIAAPPVIVDASGDPTVFRGAFERFATEVQFADGAFDFMLVRAVEIRPEESMLRGIAARIPASDFTLDAATGLRYRQILDDAAIAYIDAQGFAPTTGVSIVFYKARESDAFYAGAATRSVPFAAGRGVSLPPAQLGLRDDACPAADVVATCTAGPREVLLAANQTGLVSMFSPVDGASLGPLISGSPLSPPNFIVSNGWHVVQDPVSNCLLFSDSGNGKIARYDTDGALLDSEFINAAGSGPPSISPRGLAFRGDELLVADNPEGRILRYGSAGNYLGELITGIGLPNAVFALGNGDVLFSDDAAASGADSVRAIRAADGSESTLLQQLATPYQVARLLDGNLALAHFGAAEIRVFEDGFNNIASIAVGTQPGGTANLNPRGIWPLRNGNWLATLNNGGSVAVLDPLGPGTAYVSTVGPASSSFRYLSRACLPAQ